MFYITQHQHHWFENVRDFYEVLEWSWLWTRSKAKTCTTKAKAKAKAKTSKWCPRGSSRPSPGLEDNKTTLYTFLCFLYVIGYVGTGWKISEKGEKGAEDSNYWKDFACLPSVKKKKNMFFCDHVSIIPHCAHPRRDGQAELSRVVGWAEINFLHF